MAATMQKTRAERRGAAGAGGAALRGARRLVEPRLPEGRAAHAAGDRQVGGAARRRRHDAGAAPRARRRRGRRLARRQGRATADAASRRPRHRRSSPAAWRRPIRWKRRRTAAAAAPAPTSISIALQPAASNAVWLKRLEAAEPAARRAVYLDERSANAMNVGFFLDVAEFFLAKGERALGLRVAVQPRRDGPAEPAGAAPARLPAAAGRRGGERAAGVRAGARAGAERAAVAPRPRPGAGRGGPGADARSTACTRWSPAAGTGASPTST